MSFLADGVHSDYFSVHFTLFSVVSAVDGG